MTRELDEIFLGDKPEQIEQPSAEPTPAPAPTPESEAQPEPAASVEPAQQPEKVHGMVPQRALHASRERARTAEERLADIERENAELRGQMTVFAQQRQQPAPTPQPAVEPPKPPEFWESPDKYVEHALGPVQEQLAEATFRASRAEALSEHGKEAVAAAQEAMKQAVAAGTLNGEAVKASLLKSRDPVGDIMRWHQNSPAVQESSLREKLRAELMAELGGNPAMPATPAAATPETVMPSNLVGQRNVGTRSGPAWSGPRPLNDIFDRTRRAKSA